MLEGHFAYRGILESGAPKLHSARIVGPFETKPLLSSQTLINYCVEAEIGKQLFPMVRQALVVIQHDRQGKNPGERHDRHVTTGRGLRLVAGDAISGARAGARTAAAGARHERLGGSRFVLLSRLGRAFHSRSSRRG
jgi:hypothetical protein